MRQDGWIREKWPHEAEDFTPWLKDNIESVSKATGLELSSLGREVRAAGGRADIVAWEAKSKTKVVIENQLEPANTRHWHQLVAYGESLEARIRIWVASAFDRKFRRLVSETNRKEAAKTEGAVYYLLKIDRKNEDNDQVFLLLELGPTPAQLERVLYTEDERVKNTKLIEEFWNQWGRGEERYKSITHFKIEYVDAVIARKVSMNEAEIDVSARVFRGRRQRNDRGAVDIYSEKLSTDFPQVNRKQEWQYNETGRNILKIKKPIDLGEIDSWEEIRSWFSTTEAKIRSKATDRKWVNWEEKQQLKAEMERKRREEEERWQEEQQRYQEEQKRLKEEEEKERLKVKRRWHLYPLVKKSILDQRREKKDLANKRHKRGLLWTTWRNENKANE